MNSFTAFTFEPGVIIFRKRNMKPIITQQAERHLSFNKKLLKAIVIAWLVAGTLDISSAIISFSINTGANILQLFQYIASGIYGKPAFDGGIPMALAGLLFHYIFALIWTIFFFLIYSKIKLISINKFLVGFLYGMFVWVIMNLVVVKLSRTPKFHASTGHIIANMLYLIFFIGTPLSLLAKRYYSNANSD